MRSTPMYLIVLVFAVNVTGCAPYMFSYKHPALDESPRLKIVKVSTSSPNSQGERLHAPRIGLPIEARLEGNGYAVILAAPLNPQPVIFLQVCSRSGAPITLSGPHLRKMDEPGRYLFLLEQAKGAAISFSVHDAQGNVLGTESVTYRLQYRGFTYGIDTI